MLCLDTMTIDDIVQQSDVRHKTPARETIMTTSEINKGARTYVTSASGVKITVHKSVRNNWKTTEHRDGETNVVKAHDSRQEALSYARSIE